MQLADNVYMNDDLRAISDQVISFCAKEVQPQLELKPEDLEHSIRVLKKGVRVGKCPHCGK